MTPQQFYTIFYSLLGLIVLSFVIIRFRAGSRQDKRKKQKTPEYPSEHEQKEEKQNNIIQKIVTSNDLIYLDFFAKENDITKNDLVNLLQEKNNSDSIVGYFSKDYTIYISKYLLARFLQTLLGIKQSFIVDADEFQDEINIENFNLGRIIDESTIEDYQWRGLVLLLYGFFESAILTFSKVIQFDPNNAKAYYRRGYAKSWLKQYEKSLSDYDKAIELDPGYPRVYYRKGRSLLELGKKDMAVDNFRKALEFDSSDPVFQEALDSAIKS